MNCSEEFNDLELENFDHFMIAEKNQETIVLDSSVIFKWFHFENEDNVETARSLYEKDISRYFHVLTPELLLYEIINTFKSRTEIDVVLLEEILKELFHILIFIKLDSKDYINAYEISKKTNNSIYDSIYIAISEKYRAPFITADKKLYEALKSHNYNIVLLDDFISS
ncbi:type II toxin-antitoxin system VapC family toxin [Patescibacteria group bacterium]|nr:type II toxin-antitoxin system VapC family toxin [Patescibacteria group bacterium]